MTEDKRFLVCIRCGQVRADYTDILAAPSQDLWNTMDPCKCKEKAVSRLVPEGWACLWNERQPQ